MTIKYYIKEKLGSKEKKKRGRRTKEKKEDGNLNEEEKGEKIRRKEEEGRKLPVEGKGYNIIE